MEQIKLMFFFKIIMLLLGQILSAQNLVPNNSFENYFHLNELSKKQIDCIEKSQIGYFKYGPNNEISCPLYGTLTILLCKDWTSCNEQIYYDSPDLYNKCSIQFGVPKSFIVIPKKYVESSYQNAKDGIGYIGIGVLNAKINDFSMGWNEFIQAKLIHSLQEGQKYKVEFYANKADFSTVSTDRLGLYFSNKIIKVKDNKQLFMYKPQIANPEGKVIEDTINWVKISGIYTAKGGEQYIIIGDFYPEKENTIKLDQKRTKNFICYYFIDDVSIVPIEDNIKYDTKAQPVALKNSRMDSLDLKSIKIGVPVILKNIYFEFGKAVLLPASLPELDKLLQILNTNVSVEIEISGYTDDAGSDSYNMQLSLARAKVVADYLMGKGMAKTRITYKGYGKTKPVSTAKTEEAKLLNRRVEFKILKK